MFDPVPKSVRLSSWRRQAKEIHRIARGLGDVTNDDLTQRGRDLIYRVRGGTTLAKLVPEIFALVIEASDRVRGERHYEEQVMGGLALFHGHVAEMQTGEGKTLTATLPATARAMVGRGCHVVTVNDYLAARDAEEMEPVYNLVGLTVGALQNDLEHNSEDRRERYRRDITYGTISEFGFDFLRDRLQHQTGSESRRRRSTRRIVGTGVQRELYSALIDEADSVLLDEGRTPLVINLEQPPNESEIALYEWAHGLAGKLTPGADFHFIPEDRSSHLQPPGIRKVLFADRPRQVLRFDQERWFRQVENSLSARFGYIRDAHYMVRPNDENKPEVVIVDESTGRPMEGRKWSGGLHQAVEYKERLELSSEGGTAASVTVQSFFRQYIHLAGMTGTAMPAATEFRRSFKLSVAPIPTHRPCIREPRPVRIFKTQANKVAALVGEIEQLVAPQGSGDPPKPNGPRSVLIGTPSVDASEALSRALTQRGIAHQVLNANRLAEEAKIVSHAGETGRVTIATNMAGRGTDIKLSDEVKANGGLHVIATEMHSSARIDRQLIGRSARQGDPGSFQFFLSLEDDLLSNLPSGAAMIFREEVASEDENAEELDTEGGELSPSNLRLFKKAQRYLEREHRRRRKQMLHDEKERLKKSRDLGIDPFLEFIEQH